MHNINSSELFGYLSEQNWTFAEDDTKSLSHGIHPYPAKFPPKLPNKLIKTLSEKGDLVWDPFGGSGTTALEAIINGRNCISTDLNPIGTLIGKAKTTVLTQKDFKDLDLFSERIQIATPEEVERTLKTHPDCQAPKMLHREKWFQEQVVQELLYLKIMINEYLFNETRDVALAAFSKIITRVSNQEGETTYRAVKKSIYKGDALRLFAKTLNMSMDALRELARLHPKATCTFVNADVKEDISDYIADNSVGLIVTSPPYPNAFDYHLYHRFRMLWLGYDPNDLKKNEIGSHLKYQKDKSGPEQYEEEMKPVFENCYKALMPGRYAAFVLGDGLFNGVVYPTAEEMGKLAESLGFTVIGIIERPLPEQNRAMRSWARRASTEKILFLKK